VFEIIKFTRYDTPKIAESANFPLFSVKKVLAALSLPIPHPFRVFRGIISYFYFNYLQGADYVVFV